MFDLSEFKPDASYKHYTTQQCLADNAMMFLEFASDKAFELLDGCFDDNDEELDELRKEYNSIDELLELVVKKLIEELSE